MFIETPKKPFDALRLATAKTFTSYLIEKFIAQIAERQVRYRFCRYQVKKEKQFLSMHFFSVNQEVKKPEDLILWLV